MTLTMYDSIEISHIPANATSVAGYVDGHWATYNALKAKFPHANVLSIAVFAHDDAECLDVEQGDATPPQAPAWVKRQKTPRPCLYASVSTMNSLVATLTKAGIARGSVRLWSAHYGQGAHICGPDTCKLMSANADGTQWTDQVKGIALDQSLLRDNFFETVTDSPGGTVTPLVYQSVTTSLPILQQGVSDKNLPHWYVRRLQAILNYVYGYHCNVDGEYGPMTANAVQLLQGRYGLVKDGICGEKTWVKVVGG